MNFLQLVQRLRKETRRSGAPITTTVGLINDDADLVNWINDAWIELQRRECGWTWLQAELDGQTTVGVANYAASTLSLLATDFGRWYPAAAGVRRPSGLYLLV